MRTLLTGLVLILPAFREASADAPRAAAGAVVAPQAEGTRAGVEVLRRGGNAVDASVAVAFTIAVTFPQAGNLGGSAFLVIRHDGKDYAIDGREAAPGKAGRDMFLDAKGEVIPNKSLIGPWACGVPGSVAALGVAHEKFGSKKIPWKDLLAPAIRLARGGFPWLRREEGTLRGAVADFRDAKFPGLDVFLQYFGKDGRTLKGGDRLMQAELADTLERIANEGWREFYTGKTADRIEAEMKASGGLIAKTDLAAYEAKLREPVVGTYRGFRIVSMPPSSSGGICLVEMLNALEPHDVGALGHNTPASVHLLTEVERRAYADRAYFLGDPDFVKVPVAAIADKAFAAARMKDFDPARASSSDVVSHGEVPGFSESNETTHFSVVDAAGDAVACTTTLNGSYGSGVVVRGAGFLLNNEMDDFSAKPGVPNMFGLVGGEANAIRPGKRMLSSMTPTIVETADGRPFLVVGSPGGSTIINTVLQVIVNVIDHKMPVEKAVAARRHHHQWKPGTIQFESGALSAETVAKLKAMGHLFGTRTALLAPDWRPESAAVLKGKGIETDLRRAFIAGFTVNAGPLAAQRERASTHAFFVSDPGPSDRDRLRAEGFGASGPRWWSRDGVAARAMGAEWRTRPEFVVSVEPKVTFDVDGLDLLKRCGFAEGTLLIRSRDGDVAGDEEAAFREAGFRIPGRTDVTRGLGIVGAIRVDPGTGEVTGAADGRGIGTFEVVKP